MLACLQGSARVGNARASEMGDVLVGGGQMGAIEAARLEHGNGVMRGSAFPTRWVVRRVRVNGCE